MCRTSLMRCVKYTKSCKSCSIRPVCTFWLEQQEAASSFSGIPPEEGCSTKYRHSLEHITMCQREQSTSMLCSRCYLVQATGGMSGRTISVCHPLPAHRWWLGTHVCILSAQKHLEQGRCWHSPAMLLL